MPTIRSPPHYRPVATLKIIWFDARRRQPLSLLAFGIFVVRIQDNHRDERAVMSEPNKDNEHSGNQPPSVHDRVLWVHTVILVINMAWSTMNALWAFGRPYAEALVCPMS